MPGHAPFALVLLAAAAAAPTAVPLPGGGPIGFDDLRFAPRLGRVLVPAGSTGRLYLVDPATLAVTAVPGFRRSEARGGHGDGTTSADEGEGLLFASDRTAQTVDVVDPASRRIVSRATLAGAPDYVRWVAPTREVWVTEPDREAIELFRLADGPPPALVPAATIRVPGGPESLAVDAGRGRAYTNTWRGETVVLSTGERAIVARWRNGCRASRGIALDPRRGLVFVGCREGKATALDAGRDGAVVGSAPAGAGVDVIDFSAATSRLLVPGAESGDLTVVRVSDGGALEVVARAPTARGAHCVAADGAGNAYVCDPAGGRILALRLGASSP